MMRVTKLATVVSSILLGAAMAQAGESKITQEQFKAADKDRDGALTLAEAKGMPTLEAKFASVDTNGDGKVSAEEFNAFNKSDKSMESDQATTTPPHN